MVVEALNVLCPQAGLAAAPSARDLDRISQILRKRRERAGVYGVNGEMEAGRELLMIQMPVTPNPGGRLHHLPG